MPGTEAQATDGETRPLPRTRDGGGGLEGSPQPTPATAGTLALGSGDDAKLLLLLPAGRQRNDR